MNFLLRQSMAVVLNLFEVREHFWLCIWKICGIPKLTIQKTNKNIPRGSKYILENILLNIFTFYILKYIIKFLQSYDNDKKKKNSAFIISRNTCKKLYGVGLCVGQLELILRVDSLRGWKMQVET